ncbi:protein YIPF5 [Cimex lectularius]|uniref:Protein YIPF n=1 Tax=Cimex lectularius TaxID=79782 RepID=A0A8I6SD77_CIMLE|nr:protein YIPF5 [Cimex lectularius]
MSGQFNNMWEQEESWPSPQQYPQQQQQFQPQQQYGNSFSMNGQGQFADGSQSSGYSQFQHSDMIVNAEELAFQQNDYSQPQYNQQYQAKMSFFYDKPQIYQPPQSDFKNPYNFEDEPPLMEELGIFPDLIFRKVKLVLDPFSQVDVQEDYDLSGPLIFCLCFGLMTFLSGAKVNFGYVYGISVSSCIFMYLLLKMMWEDNPSFMTVASVLGYSMLPVVFLSTLGIFMHLTNFLGYCVSLCAVFWASWAASRGFTTISRDDSQKILVAYPCAILYGVFTLMVVF